jgi:hypothetical protein
MSDKSGLEMIEDLLDKVSLLDRRMQSIEQNMKLLLAARNASSPQGLPPGLKLNNKPAQSATANAPRLEAPNSPPKPKPAVIAAPNARVIGRIKGKDGKALPEVEVKVYDNRNAQVKNTRTNRAGDWMAFLPPGRYVAACLKEGEVNENVVFNVGPGDKIVRVGQPQT